MPADAGPQQPFAHSGGAGALPTLRGNTFQFNHPSRARNGSRPFGSETDEFSGGRTQGVFRQ